MAGNLKLAKAHEGEIRKGIIARHMARESIRRLWPLQCQKRMRVHMIERDCIGQVFAQMGDIIISHRAIHDEIKRIGPAGDHQIIEHAAICIEQQ